MTGRTAARVTGAALVLAAAAHYYWAAGGRWPATNERSLARHVVGNVDSFPSPAATIVVATGLLAIGMALAFQVWTRWPGRPAVAARWLVSLFGLGLLGRGFLGFATSIGHWDDASTTPYYRWDVLGYSPLCLLLAAGIALAVRSAWSARQAEVRVGVAGA